MTDIQITYPTNFMNAGAGGPATEIDTFDCVIGGETHFYLSPDRIIQFYRYIEKYGEIIEDTKEDHTCFIKRIFQKNLGLYNENNFSKICEFFRLEDNRKKFLSKLSEIIERERGKHHDEVWPPKPIQEQEFKDLIKESILPAFPSLRELVDIQVVPVKDWETSQDKIVEMNEGLFDEKIGSNKNKINFFIFLRHHPHIDMNIHANLCVFLPSQNLCIAYDDSGISRRKGADGTIQYDKIIDTSIFMDWLRRDTKNRLFINESLIHKDYHSCGATTISMLVSKLAFLEEKLKEVQRGKTTASEAGSIGLLSEMFAEFEKQFYTKIPQDGYRIFTEGDIFAATARSDEEPKSEVVATPDPQMLILGQRKEVCEILRRRVESLQESERRIFDIEKFLSDFETKEFILLEEGLLPHPVSREISTETRDTGDKPEILSVAELERSGVQDPTISTTCTPSQSTPSQTMRTSIIPHHISKYILVPDKPNSGIIAVESASSPFLAGLKKIIERSEHVKNLECSSTRSK